MNVDLFKKVRDSIADQSAFDMSIWESSPECGTTRCLGGWAIYHSIGGKPIFGDAGYEELSILAVQNGLEVRGWSDMIPDLAAHLLGLTAREAEIFYVHDEEGVAEFVNLAAAGDLFSARLKLQEILENE